MKRVWEKLLEVPYGTTASYKDLAIASGNEKAVRAGNGQRPQPHRHFHTLPPDHIASGKLAGHGGGLELKTWLIGMEAANKARLNGQVETKG